MLVTPPCEVLPYRFFSVGALGPVQESILEILNCVLPVVVAAHLLLSFLLLLLLLPATNPSPPQEPTQVLQTVLLT